MLMTLSVLVSIVGVGNPTSHDIGLARLAQLQTANKTFHEVGTFIDKGEEVVLAIKLVNVCPPEPLCRPLIYRRREKQRIVQYEVYNCECGKAERIAAARKKGKERLAKASRRRYERKTEQDMYAATARAHMAELALEREAQKLRFQNALQRQAEVRMVSRRKVEFYRPKRRFSWERGPI